MPAGHCMEWEEYSPWPSNPAEYPSPWPFSLIAFPKAILWGYRGLQRILLGMVYFPPTASLFGFVGPNHGTLACPANRARIIIVQ
jgi:hypothetical protein